MTADDKRKGPDPTPHDDFREVAHSGGKVTFKIITTPEGGRAYSVGWIHSRPTPAAIIGIYALPQGLACGNIHIGGIGQPWNAPPYPDCVPVLIGSDSQGRFGHECPQCGGYWRSSGTDMRLQMTCPYCGVKGFAWQFLTNAQQSYIQNYVHTLFDGMASDQEDVTIEIDMDAVVDAAATPKPEFYYAGEQQQTRFLCSSCGGWNDIKGQYAYCTACGARNNAQRLAEDIEVIRGKLNDGSNSPDEALRSAVSKFDSCCRNFVGQLCARVPMSERRRTALEKKLFHGIEDAREMLLGPFDIDIFSGLDAADIAFVRMMFGRRHVFEHDGGHATARYLKESGDASVAQGALIRETRENVHRLIGLLNRMAVNFGAGFHALFPLEQEPVTRWEERQKRMRRPR